MTEWFSALMCLLFAAHLVAFARIGLKRREWYYLATSVTFTLLTLAFGLRWLAPDLTIGELPVYHGIRMAAWAAAAVSITWLTARLVARRREAKS